MARYIDADKIYDRVKTHTNPYGKPTLDYKSGVKVLDMIEQEPTADVVEVKHGYWIEDGEYQVCSECGEEHHWDEYRATYCEDCGTRMDGTPQKEVRGMKSVLISIQPKWWKQIYKKRLELRKSKPKTETPFKCFVYETKTPLRWNKAHNNILGGEGGYVVGEFICDYILSHCEMANADVAEQMSCVPREEILKYSNGKEVYGWHISDLVIYDKPRKLSEFRSYNVKARMDENGYPVPTHEMTRPPQSWCYVEKGGDAGNA